MATGERLPASRVLADELGVSRGVVVEAYQRLTEEGLLAGHGRNGTVVAGVVPTPVPVGKPAPVNLEPRSTALFDALRAAPANADLAPGLPDLSAFPRAAWLRAERSVLADTPSASLGYADPRGTPELRASISRWIARTRGVRAAPDDIVVVAGVAQAFSLLTVLLRADGQDVIGTEDPGSFGARNQLQSWGMHTVPIGVDEDGLRVDELENSGAPTVLVTPAHQFPTGVVLAGARRAALVAWAERGGLIVEDDYDAEHRYDRHPTAALAATAPDLVCYTGSVSKLLAPALRIGWVVAPPRLRARLVAVKRDTDLGNATLPQLVLAQLIDNGDLERHLRLTRARHRTRRDRMIAAVREHLPSARIHGAAAGLHLTITFDREFADTDLARRCLDAGVKVHPLSWHRQRPGPPGLVLGYATASPDTISAGVAVIGRLLG
ncbi:GntR family transcriptional regulator/MocR family aminotransferase [Labedaea rhizosphaerae]|uniref:GntR family transcriptional regulator/MocR family aminotransferase n=1 Tax=Labedaea rhizosphaerae TaxID=598644 RepID=A0A4R6SB84_LABRH|nr:GntR family transcriptional regulator/MocR family aminotransferase [Labedaea rhizosphaerae]